MRNGSAFTSLPRAFALSRVTARGAVSATLVLPPLHRDDHGWKSGTRFTSLFRRISGCLHEPEKMRNALTLYGAHLTPYRKVVHFPFMNT